MNFRHWSFAITLQTAFTTKKDYGKEEREAQWAAAQRTLHGLQPPENSNLFPEKSSYRELSEIAEQAKRRAEVARSVFTIFFLTTVITGKLKSKNRT